MENTALQRALISGATSSILSTVAMSVVGKMQTGSAYAPTNAVSHYVHGHKAGYRDRFSLRYTVPGYLIHHASATFWSFVFERALGGVMDGKNPMAIAAASAATSAFVAFTDYKLTPRPLQPGYEKRLSRNALGVVYAGFAIGLAIGAIMSRKNEPPK
ncbi:hypothetical protein [Massilia timonae]|jgi:hypothetical protein|uniref:Uncharacterized protein n=1 Tax=Massilia timonae CCUG 45783 TaxID=883126 RepID=K9DK95_9BURK|nr:hypothetical protein [Massilia timonae]EKU83691.1 hypothetical protein HMPREF9710_00870 [Massilia timonae CCUG 45783]